MKNRIQDLGFRIQGWKKSQVAFLLLWAICVICGSAFAQDAATGATELPQGGLNPQTVILVAGLVSGAVELVKRFMKFQGRISVVVNMAAAIAAIYAVAPPEQIFSIAFLLTALQSVLTSAGVFATVSTVKGG